MNKRFGVITALVLLLVTATAQAGGLTDFSGRARTIGEYAGHGKWLVVMFWAHDCKYCNRDIASKERFYQRHRNQDITMLGISLDGREHRSGAIAFVRRHHVTFPNLIGEPQDVVSLFMQYTGDDWVGTPTFLLFDPQGKVVAEQAGAIPNSLITNFIHTYSKESHSAAART